MTEKLSDYVMRALAATGVRHVFFVPGGGAMHLNDSLGASGMQAVSNLHEQASAICAEAYAKTTGGLGAALVTCGPGGTNTVTGVAGAWLDSTPCVFISGQVKRADLKGERAVRSMGVQEVDIVSIVKPITKYAVTVLDPATIREHVERALWLATEGRPGPVWLDIPLDVQAARIEVDAQAGFTPPAAPTDGRLTEAALSAAVAPVLELLAKAQRPLLLVGNGVRLARAEGVLRELIEQLQLPTQLTWLAIDLMGDEDPLFAGRPGAVAPRGANLAVQCADVVVAVGARLDRVLTGYAPASFAKRAQKVAVDIDAGELAKLEMPLAAAIQADAGDFLRELLRQAQAQARQQARLAVARWRHTIADWRKRYPIVSDEHRAGSGPVSVYTLADVLSDQLLGGDVVVSGSSGAGIETFLHALRVRSGLRVLHTTALGAMGFGLPMAVAAALANAGQGKRTVVVDGDGGFQFNIQELQTVARLQLPIHFFVLDNDGYSSIRTSQKTHFGRTTGADAASGLTLADTERVAQAYGLATVRIASQANLAEQVRAVLAMPGPVVCNVVTIADEDRLPRIASRAMPDGAMVSTPIEDLFPFLPPEQLQAEIANALGEASA